MSLGLIFLGVLFHCVFVQFHKEILLVGTDDQTNQDTTIVLHKTMGLVHPEPSGCLDPTATEVFVVVILSIDEAFYPMSCANCCVIHHGAVMMFAQGSKDDLDFWLEVRIPMAVFESER